MPARIPNSCVAPMKNSLSLIMCVLCVSIAQGAIEFSEDQVAAAVADGLADVPVAPVLGSAGSESATQVASAAAATAESSGVVESTAATAMNINGSTPLGSSNGVSDAAANSTMLNGGGNGPAEDDEDADEDMLLGASDSDGDGQGDVSDDASVESADASAVPEPTTAMVWSGLILTGLAVAHRRRRQ